MARSVSLAGRLLKHWRTEYEFTQEQVADKVGVSRMAVSQWECGESRPSEKKLTLIAGVFGLSLASFYGAESKV